MIYENFDWTPELQKEFSKVVLDNNHCIDNIEEATTNFIIEKILKNNGRKRTAGDFVWETRNLN